jgi:DNA-directed RNA polymerase specialized sigma24 family protein
VHDPSDEALERGARLFDEGAFFEAHEAWEERWLVETDPTRRRGLQGLIQVAAGFHKLLVTGDADAASRLLAKGLAKLDASPEPIGGLEIAAFREETRECARALAEGRFDRAALPRLGTGNSLCPRAHLRSWAGMAAATKPPPAHAHSERLTPEVFWTARKKALLYAKYSTRSHSAAEELVDEALAAAFDASDSLWDLAAQPDLGGHLITIIRNKLPARQHQERRRTDEAWQAEAVDATTSRSPTLEERIDEAERQVETGRVLDDATALLQGAGHERPAQVLELWRDAVDEPVDQARTLRCTVAEVYRARELARRDIEKAKRRET